MANLPIKNNYEICCIIAQKDLLLMIAKKLRKRLNKIRASLSKHETAVINRWSESASYKETTYNFFRDALLDLSDLRAEICTPNAHASGHVLLISDSTSLNYNNHNGRLRVNDPYLGTIENGKSTGILSHVSLGICATTCLPLGYGDIQTWTRDFGASKPIADSHQKIPIEEKESYRWLSAVENGQSCFPVATILTGVHDRESDIYELFVRIPSENTHLLVRSCWDRLVESGEVLSSHIDSLPVNGTMSLAIKGTPTRTKRTATLAVKWTQVALQKPKNKKHLLVNDPDQIQVYVVDIAETADSVPYGEEAIHWRLLTTHAVNTLADAIQIAKWYSMRWWIEELFRLLKSQGFAIEDAQLSTGKGLQALWLLSLEAGLKVLMLKQARYMTEDIAATHCFKDEEIECMQALIPTLEGKTELQKNPFPPKTLKWASWLIARLGGWNPHNEDINKRPAGVIVLIRGLIAFNQQFNGWKIAKQQFTNTAPNIKKE
jgi:Transposase DDE domain